MVVFNTYLDLTAACFFEEENVKFLRAPMSVILTPHVRPELHLSVGTQRLIHMQVLVCKVLTLHHQDLDYPPKYQSGTIPVLTPLGTGTPYFDRKRNTTSECLDRGIQDIYTLQVIAPHKHSRFSSALLLPSLPHMPETPAQPP